MKYMVLAFAIAVLSAVPAFSQVAVIANKNVDLTVTKISAVSDIFTLDVQKSPGGVPLVLFDLKTGDVKNQFLAAIGKTSPEIKKIWMKAQLSGDGKAPTTVDDEDAMAAKIASTPGAVGYISAGKVTGDVKTLFTIK